MNLLFITDFTEQFAYRLLRGILDYAQETEPWMIFKMPAEIKRQLGLEEVIDWAVDHHVDVVIGQFDPQDDVSLFGKRGIVVLAQDYIVKFPGIPNITADYDGTGAMAAKRFLLRGFQNFGFVGYGGVCWSDERCRGFRKEVEEAGFKLDVYDRQQLSSIWNFDMPGLSEWLLSLPKPVAIMACDDNQGNILIQACYACGISVPSEVAILGVDNDVILCNMSVPSLSSIDVDIERGGYQAARMAAEMVSHSSYSGEDIIMRPMNIVTRSSSNVFATRDTAVLKALQFIGQNIERKIDVSDVLPQVPLSRRLLEQRFRKETGTTIYQYITMLRMDKFAEKLISSNESIANIAASMEEPDTKSISRRFLAVKGCTPTEFRRRELRKLGV